MVHVPFFFLRFFLGVGAGGYLVFLKSLLKFECYNTASALFFWPQGMLDPSSLSRDRTQAPCIGRQSSNHWTTRGVPGQALWYQCVQPLGMSQSQKSKNHVNKWDATAQFHHTSNVNETQRNYRWPDSLVGPHSSPLHQLPLRGYLLGDRHLSNCEPLIIISPGVTTDTGDRDTHLKLLIRVTSKRNLHREWCGWCSVHIPMRAPRGHSPDTSHLQGPGAPRCHQVLGETANTHTLESRAGKSVSLGRGRGMRRVARWGVTPDMFSLHPQVHSMDNKCSLDNSQGPKSHPPDYTPPKEIPIVNKGVLKA